MFQNYSIMFEIQSKKTFCFCWVPSKTFLWLSWFHFHEDQIRITTLFRKRASKVEVQVGIKCRNCCLWSNNCYRNFRQYVIYQMNFLLIRWLTDKTRLYANSYLTYLNTQFPKSKMITEISELLTWCDSDIRRDEHLQNIKYLRILNVNSRNKMLLILLIIIW